jgi:hypothetical protein
LEISLAEDDGGGSPLAGTTVSKTINFEAEVLGKRICMSQTPWLLTNTEVNETAEVFVLTIPEGWWDPINMYNVPFAAINGEYGFPKGVAQSEIYARTADHGCSSYLVDHRQRYNADCRCNH